MVTVCTRAGKDRDLAAAASKIGTNRMNARPFPSERRFNQNAIQTYAMTAVVSAFAASCHDAVLPSHAQESVADAGPQRRKREKTVSQAGSSINE